MGANQSNLSSAKYNYDYVLAVSQDSINATALAYLHGKQPVINVCFVYDDNGDPKRMDYAEFKKAAAGTDPFDIPASGPGRDAAVKHLDDAGFMYGFQAAMGLPTKFPVNTLPPIVTLGATAADPVVYRLLCRTFTLVELRPIPHKPSVYTAYAQPVGPSGQPWIFAYEVKLVQQPTDVGQFMTTPAFEGLPATTRAQVTGNPGAFSIQQLLFDFAHAACTVRPEISGVTGLLRELLYSQFGIEYFAEMKKSGPPVVAVVPKSDGALAGLQTEFSVNANPAHPELACLNYLCATADHKLPAPTSFDWNWLEPKQPGDHDYDGVCVVNRRQLAEHLRRQLVDYVEHNKWLPNPVYVEVGLVTYDARFGVSARNLDWHGKQPDDLKILVEDFQAPEQGELALHWTFHTKREFDYASGTSWMLGETAFELKVSFRGNQIIVEQRALVYCKLVMVTFWRDEWNLVDIGITDTFTLSTTDDGQLTAHLDSKTVDNSAVIDSSVLVPDLNERFTRVQKQVKAWVTTAMVDIPLAIMENVIFPGGRSFFFQEVNFSDHQDLIAHITYRDL